MAKVTLVIEDGDQEGDIKAKATFDPIIDDDGKFSLAQYLGTLCLVGIKDGSLAKDDGCQFELREASVEG